MYHYKIRLLLFLDTLCVQFNNLNNIIKLRIMINQQLNIISTPFMREYLRFLDVYNLKLGNKNIRCARRVVYKHVILFNCFTFFYYSLFFATLVLI